MDDTTNGRTTVQLLHSWVERFNRDDRAGFGALLASDVEFEQVSADVIERTAEGVLASMWGWRALFTKVRGEVLLAFADADGEHGFMAVIWSGTTRAGVHQPGGLSIRFPAWFIIIVRDGRITRAYDFYDRLTYQQQMGRSG